MTDEEHLEDFTEENEYRPAEFLVGAHRAESTDQWTARSGITTDSATFDGPTSWCKHEELIDDCLDLTVPEAEKRGPALKNRLVGDAEMHRGLLDREPLRVAGKFPLLLKRSRDAGMDMLPLSTMSEERRQNQYFAEEC